MTEIGVLHATAHQKRLVTLFCWRNVIRPRKAFVGRNAQQTIINMFEFETHTHTLIMLTL